MQPVPHAARKPKPTAHGHTIVPFKQKQHTVAPTSSAPAPAAQPPVAGRPAANPAAQPSTTHETGNGGGSLGLALGGLALATILVGGYLTRRRLRGRSRVA
jgi:hypothetical protein